MTHKKLVFHQHPILEDYTFCFHWESRVAKFQLSRVTKGLSPDTIKGMNYGVTLPGRKKTIHVHLARNYVTSRHAAHEVIGHGLQVRDMGDMDYLATYGWHFILRAGNHSKHMMEIQARSREAVYTSYFLPVYTNVMEANGISPILF